jgi:hypothetical protein
MLTVQQKNSIKKYIKDNFKVDVTRIIINDYYTERDPDNYIYYAYYKSKNNGKNSSSLAVKVARNTDEKGLKMGFVCSSYMSNINTDMADILKNKIYKTFKKVSHMSQNCEIEVEVRLNGILSKNVYLEDLSEPFNPDILYMVLYRHVPTQKMQDVSIDITETDNKVIYHTVNENSFVLEDNKDRIHSEFKDKNEALKFGLLKIMKYLINNDKTMVEFKDSLIEDFETCNTVDELVNLYDKQTTISKMISI